MFVEKLLSIASSSTEVAKSLPLHADAQGRGETHRELMGMLTAKNGFYAFEGALHVFPWEASSEDIVDVQAWNGKSLWRDCYQNLTDDLFFFAEDAFGGQFALRGNDVVTFEPESGEIEFLASSIEAWAKELLSDYEVLTGFPVAHAWQLKNGQIPQGKRLLPKIPFLLGGVYEDSNLYAVDSVKGMRYRGDLWQQIRDLPEGAQVKLTALPT